MKTPQPGMRAIVCGRGTSISNNVREYHEGEEAEARLVARIGNVDSDQWFVQFDDDRRGETRARRLVKVL